MNPITMNDILLIMTIAIFVIGIIAMIAGVLILVFRVMGDDVRQITSESAKLMHKGIAEDISGLVGNTAMLINSLDELVKTTRGVGMLLVALGFVFVLVSYYFISNIN